jgi:ribosomal-protein-alanine N-acetyltransferase
MRNTDENSSLIRPMTVADVPLIYAIECASQEVPWSEGIFKDCLEAGYNGWVIEAKGIIEGYILSYVRSKECHILNICVRTISRKKGWGRRLMEHAIADARENNADVVFLEVRVSNDPAIHLYRKIGFNEVGIRREYYSLPNGGREDALVFAMQL